MKKNKLQHSTLKLNKGSIANLQSETIFGGRDRAGQDKATNLCANTRGCTGTLSFTTTFTDPAPYSLPTCNCPTEA